MHNYRLNVRAPGETEWRVIPRDVSFIRRSGLALPLTPEGDAREARFTAKGKDLGAPCLSAVQVEHLNAGIWAPIYYGLVRQGGNQQDVNGEVYVLRSMSERLKEVSLSEDFTTPAQAAHLTVQAIIQDVLPRLAGLIEFDAALCPDLGFTFGAVNASNYETAWELLERIRQAGEALTVAGLHVPVYMRFGVRPDRFFFCTTAKTDVLELTDADLGFVKWMTPVAEKPCTHVRWLLGKQPGGRWVVHDSYSEHYATFGQYTKVVPVGQGLNPWKAIPLATGVKRLLGGADTALTGQELAKLTDGDRVTNSVEVGTTTGEYELEVTTSVTPVRWTIAMEGSPTRHLTRKFLPFTEYVNTSPSESLPAQMLWEGFESRRQLWLRVSPSAQGTQAGPAMRVFEARPEAIDTELLDGLARAHYSIPAQDPADVTLRRFVPPAELTGRVRVATWERPVEGWEYRISAEISNGGLELVAQTGQLESPQALARNTLLKAQAQRATVQALTAQT